MAQLGLTVLSHLHAMLIDPIWETALATWALVLVGIVAAAWGIKTARAAADAFRLEAQPVLLVRNVTTDPAPSDGSTRYAVSYLIERTAPAGLNFRLATREDDVVRYGTPWIGLQNVGRSPAMDVRIPVQIIAKVLELDLSPNNPENLMSIFMRCDGELQVDAIPAQGTAYIAVDRTFSFESELFVAHDATQQNLLSRDRRRQRIPIVLEQGFELKFLEVPVQRSVAASPRDGSPSA